MRFYSESATLVCSGVGVGKLEVKIDLPTEAIMKVTEKLTDIENARQFESVKTETTVVDVVDRKVVKY